MTMVRRTMEKIMMIKMMMTMMATTNPSSYSI